MANKIIQSPAAPAPIGPYSQAVQAGNLVFISGQIPMDTATGNIITDSVEEATHLVMKNLQAILTAANLSFDQVVKTTIFLTDMSLFTQVNEVYGSYFTNHFPARETVAVKGLPKNVHVEISMIASIEL